MTNMEHFASITSLIPAAAFISQQVASLSFIEVLLPCYSLGLPLDLHVLF